MTNASVDAVVAATSSRELTMAYPGGTQRIVVHGRVCSGLVPGERAQLVRGAPVNLTMDASGVALRIQAGAAPPIACRQRHSIEEEAMKKSSAVLIGIATFAALPVLATAAIASGATSMGIRKWPSRHSRARSQRPVTAALTSSLTSVAGRCIGSSAMANSKAH